MYWVIGESQLNAIAVCTLLAWGFVVIQLSKNVDRRLKRMSYITIIPFLAILANVVLQWIES
jgi:hypothetical protein